MNTQIDTSQPLRALTDHLEERPEAREGRGPMSWGRVPCAGCINELRCKEKHLACRAFRIFVTSGRSVEPSAPSRAQYEALFSGLEDDDEAEDVAVDDPKRGPRRRITDETLNEVLRLRADGRSLRELALQTGYSRKYLAKLLRDRTTSATSCANGEAHEQ